MNLSLFDDAEGLVLHEREYSYKNNVSGKTDNSSRMPDKMPLAMAYVPFQQWGEVFGPDDALENGTLFPDLIFPFDKGGKV